MDEENALAIVKEMFSKMEPGKRLEAIRFLMEDYCRYCGGEHYPDGTACQCWNDE